MRVQEMTGTASAHCGLIVQKVMLRAIISALILWVSPSLIMAADLQGSRDNPLLKRFGGSEIVAYDVKQFDDYELQIDTYKRTDLDNRITSDNVCYTKLLRINIQNVKKTFFR